MSKMQELDKLESIKQTGSKQYLNLKAKEIEETQQHITTIGLWYPRTNVMLN